MKQKIFNIYIYLYSIFVMLFSLNILFNEVIIEFYKLQYTFISFSLLGLVLLLQKYNDKENLSNFTLINSVMVTMFFSLNDFIKINESFNMFMYIYLFFIFILNYISFLSLFNKSKLTIALSKISILFSFIISYFVFSIIFNIIDVIKYYNVITFSGIILITLTILIPIISFKEE